MKSKWQGTLVGAAVVAALAVTSVAQALDTTELPGNMLNQHNTQPIFPNVGVTVNNPQNMGGGQWVGNGPTYPAGGNSFMLNGNAMDGWNGGTFNNGGGGGGATGMCNVAMAQGYYAAGYPGDQTWTSVPFGDITLIRVWMENYDQDGGGTNWWIKSPQQVEVAYTTGAVNLSNGYGMNSGTVGIIPGTWQNGINPNANFATISTVNGVAAQTPSDFAYSPIGGGDPAWADLSTSWITTNLNSHVQLGYVDLALSIPAGATSLFVSFGQEGNSTGSPGGIQIQEIQAIPEPSTLMLIGIGGLMLVCGRRMGRRS